MIGDESDEAGFIGRHPTGAASRVIDVVYLDGDAAARAVTADALADHSTSIAVTSVGTVEDALEAAASTAVSCLAVDPTTVGDIPTSLVANDRYPVVVYTDCESAASDEVLAEADTLVHKTDDDAQRDLLAEKVISIASDSVDRTEYALRDALSGIEARATADEIALLLDADGTIVWSNGDLSAVLHGEDSTEPESANFYDWLQTVLPDTVTGRQQRHRLRDEPTAPITFRVTAGEGDRYLLRRGYELPAAAGELTLVLLRDVTEAAHRDARAALLELLVEGAQDGLYTVNERGVIDFCNESLANSLGYEPDELRGKHASTVLAPGELETGQATIERLLKDPDRESTTVDLTLCRKDGTELEMSIHYTLIYDEDGTYRGLIGVARDITERLEREQAIRETTERLELALDGAELGVWDWNPQTGEVTFDERWTGMLGYTVDELEHCYETWADLVHPDDIGRAEQELATLTAGETDLYECEFRMQTKTGEWKWIRDIGKVFEWDDGEAVRAVGIHQDITAQKQRQTAIKRQRDELATLDRVNMLIQDLIHALGAAASRDEIAATVCDRIVESGLWDLAWISERTGANDSLVPQTVAGAAEECLDAIASGADGASPGDAALRTGTVKTMTIEDDPDAAPWMAAATERGFDAVAAVPLVHGDVVHGVLCVCADQPDAFSDRVVESFAVLGEMVGFAFTAVQNRQLLSHDRMLELTFASETADAPLIDVATTHACRLESAGSVDIGTDNLMYLSIDGAAPAAVLESVSAIPEVSDSRVVREDDDGGVVELQVTDTVQSLLLDVGARRRSLVVEDGTLTITVEAPPDADPRAIQETLRSRIPALSLTAKRERNLDRPARGTESTPQDHLTDRQREVLQTASLAGYYAWPRDTNAEQLASTLDIASPTLHQHLRRAERNLIDAVFDF